MLAVDSSTLIAFFQGDQGPDVDLLGEALGAGTIVLPPVVLAEVLSQPGLPQNHRKLVQGFFRLELLPDYWLRAAANRSLVLGGKLRARLADTLIAQSCIDHDVALIARNGDFRHFAKYCGLKLA